MKKITPPKTLEEALALIEVLLAKITELEERLNLNSKNSSLPPSKDIHKKKLNPSLRGVSVAVSQVIKELQDNSCQKQK